MKERILILDGAMGLCCRISGMQPSQCPELFGIDNPKILGDIHRQYVEAGSDIIQTNTFGGNAFKLAEYGLENELPRLMPNWLP